MKSNAQGICTLMSFTAFPDEEGTEIVIQVPTFGAAVSVSFTAFPDEEGTEIEAQRMDA